MSKNLLFSSVGDKTDFFNYWCDDHKDYDIIVCYYGDMYNEPYKNLCDHYFERKGSKFQNFHFLWNAYPDLMQKYENYFIIDDDIIINTSKINKLFDVMTKFKLWVLQPAFCKTSKISHKITQSINNNFMRYTNFVEICVMMLNKFALEKCMKIYNPLLVGYGIDYLFLWKLCLNDFNEYREIVDKIAIIDSIVCINPEYPGIREICKLQPLEKRKMLFQYIKLLYKFNEWKHKEYSRIEKNT